LPGSSHHPDVSSHGEAQRRSGRLIPTTSTTGCRVDATSRRLSSPLPALGNPTLDLFATISNRRLPCFVSPVPHPQAWATNALSIDWNGLNVALNTVFKAKKRLNLVQDDRISNLFRAFGIERPVTRRLFLLWDLPKVLRSLITLPYEPMSDSSLRDLTKKTMFLLSLASWKRRSEIAALVADPRHLQFADNHASVTLIPGVQFRSKTQPCHRPNESWFVPSLSKLVGQEEDRLLCPVRAL